MGTWAADATVIYMMGRRGCSIPKSGYLSGKVFLTFERKELPCFARKLFQFVLLFYSYSCF
jgi:hypothetical protein